MMKKFIYEICEILNIQVPSISYDTTNFQSNTMMAQCNSSGSTIYLKKYNKPNPDQLFAIAHELRHVWQIKNNYELYFSNYKTINKLNVNEYNLQIAEIDANAFASIIMIDFFHLQQQYKNMSSDMIIAIKNRMKKIAIELSE